ncbi:MAG: SH3 domain-containing protein [Proteobacteria bacterium]|nr:SH3 domain-containing protein [Pseudomonadota bacterium]
MSLIDKLTKQVTDINEKAAEIVNVAHTEEEAVDADITFFMPLDPPVIARVTCDVLNVRPSPSTDLDRVGQLKRGAEIKVCGLCDDWLEIDFEGTKRYVFGAYTDYEAPELTVTASALNIRKGPSTDSEKIGSLPNGTVVRALAESKGWVKILSGNKIGYVSREYLK